ncbi:MAG TPA: putative toxin-antitoxin system toxin component, PIN family [Thermoanaerobaculia bacterium]|nr:putative toxin-antitoxin system toxin component, PIN family [Thermoanaerobaculia bacterium]
MKVVFDTNVYVSALVLSGSRGEEALARILQGRDRLLISKPILDELLGVLARKFSRDAEELARVAVFLDELAERVETGERLAVLSDEPDNRILECALAGGADAVVTGDKPMLALVAWRGIEILSLARYLDS